MILRKPSNIMLTQRTWFIPSLSISNHTTHLAWSVLLCKSISSSQAICLPSTSIWHYVFFSSLTIDEIVYVLQSCLTKGYTSGFPSGILEITHGMSCTSLTKCHYYCYSWCKVLRRLIFLRKLMIIPEHFIFTKIVAKIVLSPLIFLLILLAFRYLLFFSI